jgi:hypothetical protein
MLSDSRALQSVAVCPSEQAPFSRFSSLLPQVVKELARHALADPFRRNGFAKGFLWKGITS